MLPLLTHAVALTVLPTGAARLCVAVILGLGGGVLAITLREQWVAGDQDTGTKNPSLRSPAGHWPAHGNRQEMLSLLIPAVPPPTPAEST